MSHCTSLGSIVNDTVSGGGSGTWNFNEAGVVLETEEMPCAISSPVPASSHTPAATPRPAAPLAIPILILDRL